jgi:ribosomal-protein-alanine N-acetyltransferase
VLNIVWLRRALTFQVRPKGLFALASIHATNLAIVPKTFALVHESISVRLLRMKDAKHLERLVLGNRQWLKPWEATNPVGPNSFDIKGQSRGLLRQYDEQQGIPFVIELDGQLVGQLNVANILYGSVSSAVIGYWIAPEAAGRGVMTPAVALVSDYLFNIVGLHRVEINIRPENLASLRIVEKLGFRFEGLKERYIHINGDWRDHYIFAITYEEVRGGVLNRFLKGAVPDQRYPLK